MDQFVTSSNFLTQLELLNERLEEMNEGTSNSWEPYFRRSSCESWGEEYHSNFYPSIYHKEQLGGMHYNGNQPHSFFHSYDLDGEEHIKLSWLNEHYDLNFQEPSESLGTHMNLNFITDFTLSMSSSFRKKVIQ